MGCQLIPDLSFRAATAADAALLFEIFATARRDHPEIAGRDPTEQSTWLENEFAARQRSYALDFPGVEYLLIYAADEVIGRLYLQRTRRVIFVVDIVLLPPWRGRGLGSGLLRQVMDEAFATRRVVHLHVEKINQRAFRLYERLGFHIIGDVHTHHLMEARPCL